MKRKILIADNNGELLEKLDKACHANDYETILVSTFEEIRSALRKTRFDVAIVNYTLPDAAGGAAILHCTQNGIPTIALTPSADDGIRDNVLAKKVADYFQIDSDTTIEQVSRLLYRLRKNNEYTVLIVDDSQVARLKFRSLLTRHGYNVEEAIDGSHALKFLQNNQDIKIVISDYEMPAMDGVSFVKEVRKIYSKDDLAIIGVSASGRPGVSSRFLKYGANDYLNKPFCEEEFYCRLTNNVENLENIEQIKKSANTDYLTKLWNRRNLYTQILNHPQYRKKNINIAMLDIDFFKRINDSFGHDTGDLALIHLSNLIKKHFPNEMTSRFGGEEFCIADFDSDFNRFCESLSALRADVFNKPLMLGNKDIRFSVSIGAVYSQKELSQNIIDADTLLYKAKKSGRNRLVKTQSPCN